jgi:serine protease Do
MRKNSMQRFNRKQPALERIVVIIKKMTHFAFGVFTTFAVYAQGSAEVAFYIGSPSVAVIRTDTNKAGSAVAYYSFGSKGTGLLTNCHVLVGAKTFTISQKGRTVNGLFLAGDQERDLCLVGGEIVLPKAEPRDFSSLRVGEEVFAIGAPRGIELSISNGIIGQIRGSILEPNFLIQTTAPISPGSSGGGLFDSKGRLIGITTFMLKDSPGLNFAVAINMANGLTINPPARNLSDLK